MVNTSESRRFAFRVHGFRYQSRDVWRAVAFYTTGFWTKHQQVRPSQPWRVTASICCPAGPRVQARGRCRTGSIRSLAGGTGWCWR